jgi:hypothetical protein
LKDGTRESLIAKTLYWRLHLYFQKLIMEIPQAVFDAHGRSGYSANSPPYNRNIVFDPPLRTGNGELISAFSILKEQPYLGEAILKDGSKKNISDIYFQSYIGKIEIQAKEKLTIEFPTESTLIISFRGKEVRAPIEQWIAHNKELGLLHFDTQFDRIAKAVSYAWDIAVGITEWKIGKKVISLNDILA